MSEAGQGDEPVAQAPTPEEPLTVLERVQRRIGARPRLTVPDEGSEHGVSPLIDNRTPDAQKLPEGRGHYQVMGEIARGGMGVVLKSHDTDLGRDVAMKVLRREHADQDAILQRFVEEAQIGGQLQHPGIVPVYELGLMEDERPYFTMKLVKGRTLAKLLAERDDPAKDRRTFLGIFEKVVETMAYAHARHVIHRDLKPANIMVGAFGEVQVVDWGLAKVLREGGVDDERAQLEQSQLSIIATVRSGSGSVGSESMVGSVMGTPAYMPPEQAQGDIDRLDERADVFALGAILCEILTGAPPYGGQRDEILEQAARAKLDPARERMAACGADKALVELAERCLTPARTGRPRSAEPLLTEVQAWLAGQEQRMQRAQVAAAEARVRALAERKARRLTLTLAATVVLAVLAGGFAYLRVQANAHEARAAIVRRVDDHLATAAARRGQGDFEAAYAACDQAQAVAEAARDDELLVHVGDARAAVGAAEQLAAARVAEQARRDAFLAQLGATVLDGRIDFGLGSVQRSRRDAMAAAFASYDLDPVAGDPSEVEPALAALDAPVLVGQVLDEFARLERKLAGFGSQGWRRLSALARSVDPDPWRNRLRDAIERDDRRALEELVSSEAAMEWPPTTVAMMHLSLMELGFAFDMEPVLRACQRRHPDDPTINTVLGGYLFFDQDDPVEGLRYTSAALALRPGRTGIAIREVWCLGALGRVEEATARLCELIEDNPEQGWLTEMGLRNLLWRVPHEDWYAITLEVMQRASDVNPGDGGKLNNLAWATVIDPDATRDELERAVGTLEQSVELEPDEAAGWNSLGYARVRLGQWAQAVTALQRSIDLLGRMMAEDALGVAIALHELGERDLAREWIGQARLQWNPNGDTAWHLDVFWAMADERFGTG